MTDPCGKASGTVVKDTTPSCRGVHHETSHQVVAESGMVDHLDEEVVRNGVKHLRKVHRYGYGSARRFALVEARNYPSRDGEQGQGGGMHRFEAMLGGSECPAPLRWTGG